MAKQMKHKIKSKSRKVGKKGFYEIEVPMTSIKISIYGSSPEEFDGKVITMDLTKSLRGKSLILKLKIKNNNGNLMVEPKSAILASSYVRKGMRRGTDYIEDAFDIKCRDNIVRVKPLLITRKRVSRAVRRVLRDETKKFIDTYFKIRDTKDIFSEIITMKIQKNLAAKLKKIYPLGLCEIKSLEIKRVTELDKLQEENLDTKQGSKNKEIS